MMRFSRFFFLPILGWLLVHPGIALAQTEQWNFTTAYLIDASPAVAPDGTIYVPSYENIYAMTPGGSNKWVYPALSGGPYPSIFSSPAIGQDGTIYFGGYGYYVNTSLNDDGFYAVDGTTGTNKWIYSVQAHDNNNTCVFFASPAIGPDGAIYIGSFKEKNNDTPYLYAFNTNGTLRWRYAPASSIYCGAAISQDGATIYFGSDDGKLYALSTNGTTLRWTFSTGDKAITAAPAIGRDGKIYIGVGSVLNPKFYCVNTNGTTNWVFTCTNRIQSSAAIGDDGTIYFGSDDMHLYALNTNGTLKWSAFTGATNASSPAIAADGTIYTGSDNGNLYAFNRSGSNLWTFTTGGVIFSSPAIGTNGTVYICSEDSKVYALNGSSGLARAPWPMSGHDLRHTAKYTVITNTPPLISVIGNQTNIQNTTLGPLAFTVSDAETPAGNLAISGVSSNTVLVSNAALLFSGTDNNRFLTLTPATNQFGVTRITLTVTDSAGATNTTSFLLTVIAGNNAPQFVPMLNQTNNELTVITLTNVATDSDAPAQTLTFSLLSGPTNCALNSASGVFTWTPTEAQGPSTNILTVSVTDNGSPNLSATNTFTLFVNEVNSAPVLTVLTNQTLDELTTLNITETATDSDIPTNKLTFAFVSGPAGLSVSTNGAILWTPAENQGPSTNTVMVRVFDDGAPSLSATQSFQVIVREVNLPPVLSSLTNLTVHQGTTISLNLSATDLDIPANTLTFSLKNAPAGAGVNASSGLFTWTPAVNQVNTTNTFGAIVTDNGSPSLSATNPFIIVVVPPPRIQSLTSSSGNIVITWGSLPQTSYRVQYKTNLADNLWNDLAGDIQATDYTSAKTNFPVTDKFRFYRIRVLP